MTLTNALRSASSAITANARQVSILSRNISGVGDENYVRRQAVTSTGLYGTIRTETQRYVNRSVYDASTLATAGSVRADVVAAGFDRLSALHGPEDFSSSPASLLGELQQAVELAAASPSSGSALSSLIEKARTVANSLNRSYQETLSMRASADKQIANSVISVNSLLGQLKTVNDQIVSGSRLGEEVFDQLDIRDDILAELSEEIGLKIVPRDNNDIILMTNNGLLLFEKTPRAIVFQATPSFDSTTVGSAVYIDGVSTSGGNTSFTLDAGRIAGNLELRDNVLVQQQHQLDEISRSLIDLFAEQDQTISGSKPKTTGLFTWSGGPAVPASATLESGIAFSISLNPLVDPQTGGNTALVRDGGINGDPDYIYNPAGGEGFSNRLYDLSSAFNVATGFDSQANLPTSQSLLNYAASSLDWLNGGRQRAHDSRAYQNDLAFHYKQTLQNETGPNLDVEMSRLLEIERSYQASAKLISTIDEMFSTLLNSVR